MSALPDYLADEAPDDPIAGLSTAEKLFFAVRVLHDAYSLRGRHTWRYWRNSPEGWATLGEMLDILLEDMYPDEWAAAWAQYPDDDVISPLSPPPPMEAGQ